MNLKNVVDLIIKSDSYNARPVLHEILNIQEILDFEKVCIDDLLLDNSLEGIAHTLVKRFDEVEYNEKITGLIMVRDQQDKILEAINSALTFCDDIYVFDTGSKDETLNVLASIKNDKVKVSELPWVEDFGLMRNKCKENITTRWLFYYDSDEILTDKQRIPETEERIKGMLAILDILFQSRDISITEKAYSSMQSLDFVSPDRLIKNTKTMNFFGKVHEQPRSNGKESNMLTIPSKIASINTGNSDLEKRKFNKSRRYIKLTEEMIKKEPKNPRWVALLDGRSYLNGNLTIDYPTLLRKAIFKDINAPISYDNVNVSKYLETLLIEFVTLEVNQKDLEGAEGAVSLGRRFFPNNSIFIFLKYSIKKHQVDQIIRQDLHDMLRDYKEVGEDTYNGSDERILVLISRMLFSIGEQQRASEILKDVKDPIIVENANDLLGLVQ